MKRPSSFVKKIYEYLMERLRAIPASIKTAYLLGVSTVILLLILIWNLLLPHMVEKRVLSLLEAVSGNLHAEVTVQSITLSHADLSIRLYQNAGHTVQILRADSVILYYIPSELLRGRLRDAALSGLEIPVYLRQDGLRCPAFDLLTSKESSLWSGFISCFPDGAGKNLSGKFRLFYHGKETSIPFRGELLHPEKRWSRVNAMLLLEPECGKVTVSGDYDDGSHTLNLKAEGKGLSFDLPLRSASPLLDRETLSIRSNLSADGVIDTDTWELTHSGALLNLNVQLKSPYWNPNFDTELNWMQDGAKRELLVPGIGMEWNKVPIYLDSLTFTALPASDGFCGSFRLSAGSRASFPVNFSCRPEKEGLAFSMATDTTASRGRQIFTYQDQSIEMTDPEFELNVTASGTRFETVFTAKAESLLLRKGKDSIAVPHPLFEGGVSMLHTESGLWQSSLNASASLNDSILEFAGWKAVCRKLVFSGEKQPGTPFSGLLEFEQSDAQFPPHGIQLEKGSAHIPFLFPLPETTEAGTWSVARVLKDGKLLGTASGKITVSADHVLHLSGTGTAPVQQFQFQADAGYDHARSWTLDGDFQFPEQDLKPHAGLAEFFPQMKEFTAAGKLQAQGNAHYAAGKFSGKGKVRLHDLKLSNEKLGMTAEGGDVTLTRTEDAALTGSVRIEKLNCDKVGIGATDALFSYRPADGWRMERFLSHWCGGTVRIDPTALSSVLHTELHCEKLDLADFLRQTGLGKVTGKGNVSGTIPVSREAGKELVIKDGLLFSAPDENGELRGSLDAALAGGDALTPEMALAQDALRDFTYSWTRLTMNSDGQTLQMNLQFDGKPNIPLYFEYKSGTGFLRSRTPHTFQHLKLDVNAGVRMQLIRKVSDYFSSLAK